MRLWLSLALVALVSLIAAPAALAGHGGDGELDPTFGPFPATGQPGTVVSNLNLSNAGGGMARYEWGPHEGKIVVVGSAGTQFAVRVREVGIGDARLARGPKGLRRFLTAWAAL
jgi:hypothetical protein